MKCCKTMFAWMCLGVVALPQVAMADTANQGGVTAVPNDKQKQAEAFAQKAYDAYSRSEFTLALSLYMQAYQMAPTAALLYNVANIYDKKIKDPTLALDFYRKYINAADADPELVLRATARISALNSEIASASSAPSAAPKTEPSSAAAPQGEAPGPQNDSGRTLRLAGLVTGGVGVLGVAVGSIFGIVAKGKHDDAAALCTGKTCSDPKGVTLMGDASSAATVSTVFFTIGVAAVAGGAAMYLLAPSSSSSKTGIRVEPMFSTQVAGIRIGGVY